MTCYTEYRLYLFNKQIPCYVSPESRRNSGGRLLSIFMAAIFVFNGSGTVGRKRNLYQGGGRRSTVKNKEGGRGGRGVKITFLTLPLLLTPTGQSNSKSNMAGRINHSKRSRAQNVQTLAPPKYLEELIVSLPDELIDMEFV